MASTPVIFISIPYSTIKNEKIILAQRGIGVNMLIDTFEIDLPFLINYVHGFNNEFIYTISDSILTDINIRNIFPGLYILFCLSATYRNSLASIPVLSDKRKQNLSLLNELKKYFFLQGEKDISFAFFQPQLSEQSINSIVFIDKSILASFNQSLFNKFNEWAPDVIIISVSEIADLDEVLALIEIQGSQNQYVKLAIEQCELRRRANSIHRQCMLWKARSELYYSFIGLSKKVGEAQYYDILNWYEKEYESLPLWYKRFGHILKVITGKRTFNSLFSDNIKTYKD